MDFIDDPAFHNIEQLHHSSAMDFIDDPAVHDIFTFSPFGLGCRKCNNGTTIQFDERCIHRHLNKHGIKRKMETIRSFLDTFKTQVENAKRLGTIELYRSDDKVYMGYSCICGLVFQLRKDNALRHCKKLGCDASKLQEVELLKLCCGRFVSQGQVKSLYQVIPPRVTEQFNYSDARAALLPYLPKMEKEHHTYTHMFTPLITQSGGATQFETKIKIDCNAIHSVPSPTHEPLLINIHEQAETWLLKFAQKNILMVPGNLRAALQTFEGGEVDDISQRSVYTMQHNPTTLLSDLKKLLSFAFRRGFFSGKIFNADDGFAIAYHLKDLMLEIPASVQHHPLAVEFCLMSGFRVETTNSNKITMISCDTVSSIFAKVSSILKAAICSVICSYTEDAFSTHGPALVTAVRKSVVLHSLSPMLRQIREMHRRLPKRRKTTLDEYGNIVVDEFLFRFDDWSQLVPRTVCLMKVAISHLADGIWWEPIVDVLAPVKVRVDCDTGDLYVAYVTPIWKQASDSHLLEHFNQLVALLKMAFHGFGGGSARLKELSDPTMFHCIYTNGTVYYTFASIKGFNTASRRTCKEIQRKLPHIIARYFLLYRSFIQTQTSSSSTEITNDDQQNLIFPSRIDQSDIGPQHIIRDLFSLSAPPNMTQVRHFWAGVSNFITGGESQPNHYLSSNSLGASKMGHSSLTHAITYSSQKVGAEESHFNAYHFAIGDTSHQMLQSKEHISLVDLRNAIQLRHPMSTSPSNCLAHYLSMQQKELVEFAYTSDFRNKPKHCLALLAPGEGKSESYLVPTIARHLANQKSKMIVHVSPFRFLAAYQGAMASTAFNKIGLKSSICVFSGCDINPGFALPEELQEKENLPCLLFLNVDALYNLFHHFRHVLTSWVDVVDKFVVDEVHTILTEMRFRDKYKVYSHLASLGIPIVLLSGSLPVFVVNRFAKQLGLSRSDDLSDVKLIQGNHVVGSFPKGFKIKVSMTSRYVFVAAHFVKKRLDSGNGVASAVHVVVAEKADGAKLLDQFSVRYKCKFVSSDSTQDEVKDAATEWSKGQLDILISTTMGLVGNENPHCRHLVCVGYLYDSMQIVQFLGRLRKSMRTEFGHILFAVPDNLSEHRLNDDGHRYTKLLHEKYISAYDQNNFNAVMTSSGVRQWLLDTFQEENGCSIKLLSVAFGRQMTENCGACPFCRRIPLTVLQSQANSCISLEEKQSSAAETVLKKLASVCLVCKSQACRGIPFLRGVGSKSQPENQNLCFQWKMCITCGIGTHDRKVCRLDKTYLNNRACCECWVMKGVAGSEKHDINNCPVKGRLRRLLSHSFLQDNVPGTYQTYVENIYTSKESFCQFLATKESN